MKDLIRVVILASLLACCGTGCIVATGPPEYETDVVQPLPAVVELGPEPYYYHRGYHYYYHDNRWDYSRDRRGPWRELPRSHWPRETRFKGAPGGEMRGHERR
ncbi:hypothetical protein [Geomesophilobacter sediminis]|uniref:Lipoprotein n=1 Tax=Geomesophilobacter sediminis TaxID=2798584 RepID=A0A8J7IPJ7_9BACT|nr:hypothetical protein [Geomesophilobacter sediminis]MBJ6725508.1 hypothetical protein [Geomesophilobacter sediminis]